MTQDEYEVGTLEDANKFAIIRMAMEADIDAEAEGLTQALERFAALVAAHENATCEAICEENETKNGRWCAAAIRARGEK